MQEAIHQSITQPRAKAHRTDAELLALCAEFEERSKRADELYEAVADLSVADLRSVEAYEEMDDLVARGWEIRTALTDLPAHTREGLLAKARVALWETCDGDLTGRPEEGSDTAVAWSLALDVLRGAGQ